MPKLYAAILSPMGSTQFGNPQALSSALASLSPGPSGFWITQIPWSWQRTYMKTTLVTICVSVWGRGLYTFLFLCLWWHIVVSIWFPKELAMGRGGISEQRNGKHIGGPNYTTAIVWQASQATSPLWPCSWRYDQ